MRARDFYYSYARTSSRTKGIRFWSCFNAWLALKSNLWYADNSTEQFLPCGIIRLYFCYPLNFQAISGSSCMSAISAGVVCAPRSIGYTDSWWCEVKTTEKLGITVRERFSLRSNVHPLSIACFMNHTWHCLLTEELDNGQNRDPDDSSHALMTCDSLSTNTVRGCHGAHFHPKTMDCW